MKTWILNNLVINNKLVSKRINKNWFDKNGHNEEYTKIIKLTDFIETDNISQRIWHIVNDIYSKVLCNCGNKLKFIGYWRGYASGCSMKCVQKNVNIMNKIKETNLKKYGVEYPQQSSKIKNKSMQTCLKKYNVKNISCIDDIKLKKRKTLFNNYETTNIFDISKKNIIAKYGVDNAMKNKSIRNKSRNVRLKNEYKKLFNSDRFLNKITLAFDMDEYDGVYGGKIYSFICNKCGGVFQDSLEKGKIPRCINCYPIKNNSMFQKKIYEYINSIYTEKIIENDRKILNGKELDIYLPDKNLAIECNGLYYHSEISGNKDKNYHLNKTILCENKGIRLIHIFEDEWLNKSSIVKMRLRNISGLNDDRIYGKQCIINEITNEIKSNFLDKYHIQGSDNSNIRLGIFYNTFLVGVMTFGKRRLALGKKNSEDGEYELLRYATSTNVVGGAGKLLSYFIKNYQPKKIVSYADRRWSQGNLYEKLGFNLISNTPVNYWYFDKNYMRLHRFNFRKNILNEKLKDFDPNLTEWQNMQINGYDRIWDCGNYKYEMFIEN